MIARMLFWTSHSVGLPNACFCNKNFFVRAYGFTYTNYYQRIKMFYDHLWNIFLLATVYVIRSLIYNVYAHDTTLISLVMTHDMNILLFHQGPF